MVAGLTGKARLTMARKPARQDTDPRQPASRVTLPRRGGSPLRIDAWLVDEMRLSASTDGGEMHLRLWQGRSRLAVEVVVTGPQGAVLDATTAPGIDGIADWLEALDPWADGAPSATPGADVAAAVWADAVNSQWRHDFRWLVGEALYCWQGTNTGVTAGLETAS